MPPRAIWKGHLKIAELACPVALHAAASTSERVSFRIVDRRTGNPVRRDYVDADTEAAVPREEQVKGYEIDRDRFVAIEQEELAEALPESDKTLTVEAFLTCSDIDTTYFDKPYYLRPASTAAEESFTLIREAMRARHAAALARAVLFRRVRTVLVRAQGCGLVANTLAFDYEVRPARQAFRSIPERDIAGEMLDLARHIIKTRGGSFDPSDFHDRYEAALAELPAPEPAKTPVVVDLMEALRRSAGAKQETAGGRKRATRSKGRSEAPRRKAG
jgi:DNA end-binding protein Ku